MSMCELNNEKNNKRVQCDKHSVFQSSLEVCNEIL